MDRTLLLQPNIPKPLHGIAPRVIYGLDWWDVARRKTYAAAGYCCEACGARRAEATYHPWLEAHEIYTYDYPNGRLTFTHLVALCHACHNFIHDGRMRMEVATDHMALDKYLAIIRHGSDLLEAAGLYGKWLQRHVEAEDIPWLAWRMVVDGKEYGPSTHSYAEWQAGLWRNWRP